MDTPVWRRVREIGLARAASEFNYAAVLFTYRCTIACKHCLFSCTPENRPDVVMPARACVDALPLLHETGRLVHIAGGEPMLYRDELVAALDEAHAEDVPPHFIETNASFAGGDRMVRERFSFFKDRGVAGVYISACPYHQEHVPPENFLRARRTADEIFGPENVMAPPPDEERIRRYAEIARDETLLAEHVRNRPPMLVGNGAKYLARHLDAVPVADAPAWDGWVRADPDAPECRGAFEGDRLCEIHIDPYGNILNNCSLVLGRIDETTPARVLAENCGDAGFIVRMLRDEGPWALAEFARREHGFEIPETVRQKCELCFLTRRFLHARYPEQLGPPEVFDMT